MPSPAFYSRMGRLSAIILVLPSAMAAGALLGYYGIDFLFGVFPWGTLLGVLAGAAIGFYEIIQILLRDQGASGKEPVD